MYSFFDWVSPDCPVGKFTFIPFMWTWLKLTIMKLASKKNMMSINGMISIRALCFGTGELTRIKILDRRAFGRTRRVAPDRYFTIFFTFGFQHDFEVRGCRLQFEL